MIATRREATIDVEELGQRGGPGWNCIDVRSATEFAAGHIPAAINIPMDEIECRLSDLPRERVVLVCQAGKRAEMTIEDGALVVKVTKPRKRRRYDLEQLIGQITEENRHAEIDWGPAVGNEVW